MRTLRQLLSALYRDESGFVEASNYILMATILAIGAVAGLTGLRDSVVQELGDLGLALENIDQTYTINATFGRDPFGPVVKQFGFQDTDASDGTNDDVPGAPPACIDICQAATPESN